MARFTYIAANKNGKERRGTMEASDYAKACLEIKALGLTPLEVTGSESIWSKSIQFKGKAVKPRELSIFCRQFVSILQAGIPVREALSMMVEQTENKAFGKVINEVRVSIEKGEGLAASMHLYPKFFPPLMTSLVEAGEASGSLDLAFTRLAIQFEKDAKLKGMILKALMYPVILLITAFAVMMVMLIKVIPNYVDIFKQMDTELPAITQMVVSASEFMQSYWYFVVVGILLLIIGVRGYSKTDKGRIIIAKIAIHLPLFGKLTIKTASARMARTLSTMLLSGLSLLEALEITAKSMENALFKDAIIIAREDVARGFSLAEPIKNCGLFPPLVTHMIEIGEKTGTMDQMLEKLADYYEEEVEIATQTVMAALEPMIIIVMAAIVGILVVAIMAPMTSMYNNLGNV
ncbi:MAG: type II secretion system F family protein [Lachnospiraceae bacterium]